MSSILLNSCTLNWNLTAFPVRFLCSGGVIFFLIKFLITFFFLIFLELLTAEPYSVYWPKSSTSMNTMHKHENLPCQLVSEYQLELNAGKRQVNTLFFFLSKREREREYTHASTPPKSKGSLEYCLHCIWHLCIAWIMTCRNITQCRMKSLKLPLHFFFFFGK